jgi:hypothetical protein
LKQKRYSLDPNEPNSPNPRTSRNLANSIFGFGSTGPLDFGDRPRPEVNEMDLSDTENAPDAFPQYLRLSVQAHLESNQIDLIQQLVRQNGDPSSEGGESPLLIISFVVAEHQTDSAGYFRTVDKETRGGYMTSPSLPSPLQWSIPKNGFNFAVKGRLVTALTRMMSTNQDRFYLLDPQRTEDKTILTALKYMLDTIDFRAGAEEAIEARFGFKSYHPARIGNEEIYLAAGMLNQNDSQFILWDSVEFFAGEEVLSPLIEIGSVYQETLKVPYSIYKRQEYAVPSSPEILL